MVDNSATRRKVLKSAGVIGAAGIAGCTGGNGNGNGGNGNGGNGGNGNGGNGNGDGGDGSSDFPTEPITYIVPFSEGGGTDMFARQMAPGIEEELGEPVQVENQPGAASLRGIGQLHASEPDGYTIGGFNPPSTPVSWLVHQPDWDITELKGVGIFSGTTYTLCANQDLGIETGDLDDVMSRFQDGELETIGAQQPGSITHIISLILRDTEGIDIEWERFVGYDGAAPTVSAIASGEVPVGVVADKAILGSLDQIDVVGILAQDGSPVHPDLPGGSDLGIPDIDYIADGPMATYAPPETPDEILEQLNAGMATALERDEMQEWADGQNFPLNEGAGTPEEAQQAMIDAVEQIPENVDIEMVREEVGSDN